MGMLTPLAIGWLIPAQLGGTFSIVHDIFVASVVIAKSVISPPISSQPYLFL